MGKTSNWNWQQADWPNFRFDPERMEASERAFLRRAGEFSGTIKHIAAEDEMRLRVELLATEALKTSEIEGETLNRDSLHSSILKAFGLATDKRRIPPAEQGISAMMVDLFTNHDAPLAHETLFRWHTLLMQGSRKFETGKYRSDPEPMQVVSGPLHQPNMHFEAIPAERISEEMSEFIDWFNRSGHLPALTRAGIAHWHFVCIHPFEDGNGRIGRALAEKALAQSLGVPSLIAVSQAINTRKKEYYRTLAAHNRTNEITDLLEYFGKTILEGLDYAQQLVDFTVCKSKVLSRLAGKINVRQEKALLRLFHEGPQGFEGGLSAIKYIRLTGASRATATRDLNELVELNALIRSGERKSTRYYLRMGEARPSDSRSES